MDLSDAYAITAHTPGADALLADLPGRSERFRAALDDRVGMDVPYGTTERQIFDLYHPQGASGGTLVFIHGGYWRAQHGRTFGYLAAGALGRGWQAAHPSYDLCPAVHIRDITRQIVSAICAVAARTDGPLALAGHSAGGHLAARMLDRGLLPPEVAGRLTHVMAISPLSDLRPLLQTDMNADLRLDAAEAAAESPVLMTDLLDVPVTVVVGANERPALLDQALGLSEAWGTDLQIVQGRHHFDVIDALADPDSDLVARLIA
ncbi:MAG: alpha/beta hydrolase [Marinibacterium sp.]